MFFSCPALTNFWQIYFNTMSKVLWRTSHTSPHIGIFGLPEDYTLYSTKELGVIAFTSLLAKRHLLLNLKSTTAPSSTQWIKETMSFLEVEKIRYTRGNLSKLTLNLILEQQMATTYGLFLPQCNPHPTHIPFFR